MTNNQHSTPYMREVRGRLNKCSDWGVTFRHTDRQTDQHTDMKDHREVTPLARCKRADMCMLCLVMFSFNTHCIILLYVLLSLHLRQGFPMVNSNLTLTAVFATLIYRHCFIVKAKPNGKFTAVNDIYRKR